VAEEGAEMQRRPAVAAVGVDGGRIVGEQTLDSLEFAGGAGFEDGQRHAARHQQVHNFLLPVIHSG
jgi:hypothetical protein